MWGGGAFGRELLPTNKNNPAVRDQQANVFTRSCDSLGDRACSVFTRSCDSLGDRACSVFTRSCDSLGDRAYAACSLALVTV